MIFLLQPLSAAETKGVHSHAVRVEPYFYLLWLLFQLKAGPVSYFQNQQQKWQRTAGLLTVFSSSLLSNIMQIT